MIYYEKMAAYLFSKASFAYTACKNIFLRRQACNLSAISSQA